MKTTMEKDTILFVGNNNYGIAMEYNYYNKNYYKVDNKIESPIAIYYKVGNTSDTWIDLEKAIQLLPGSFTERVLRALELPDYRITDITKIPACDYYDAKGYINKISPYDGQYDSAFWVKRCDDLYLKGKNGYDYSIEGNHLYIRFNEDIDIDLKNSMISLNGLFTPYKILGKNLIKYINIVDQLYINQVNFTNMSNEEIHEEIDLLKQKQRTGTITDAETIRLYNLIQSLYKMYTVKINVYTWENIEKSENIPSVGRNGEWITLSKYVDDNCFVIYKGQMLDYEVNEINKSKIRLKDVDIERLRMFDLSKLYVYQMTSTEQNRELRKFIAKGINNRHRNTVDFVLPVEQSLVVYEGIDHEYEIIDEGTVLYSGTKFSPSFVNDYSTISQINFTVVG